MVNPFTEVNWRPGRAEQRKFALSWIYGFPCVALLLFVVKGVVGGTWRTQPALWIGGIGLGLGLFLLAAPWATKPFYFGWYFAACSIGIVVSNLLLISFYYLVVTPVGLLLRFLGRPPLKKRPEPQARTYWLDAERVSDLRQYYRQY